MKLYSFIQTSCVHHVESIMNHTCEMTSDIHSVSFLLHFYEFLNKKEGFSRKKHLKALDFVSFLRLSPQKSIYLHHN